jgi:hypothetical protein
MRLSVEDLSPVMRVSGFIVGLETVTAGGGAGTVVVGILVLLVSVGLAAGALMDFLMLLKVSKDLDDNCCMPLPPDPPTRVPTLLELV